MFQIETLENGNEVTVFHSFTGHGDTAECHAEPPTCGCV